MADQGKCSSKDKFKAEVLAFLKGCDDGDVKEMIAELSEQFIELGAQTDLFTKEIKDLVLTLSAALYFYSISNLALQDLLISSGVITRKDLLEKISDCPEKKKLAAYLGLNFLSYPGVEKTDKNRLAKWLDPLSFDKIRDLLQ